MSPSKVFDVVAIISFGIAAIPWPTAPNPYWQYLISLGLVFFTLGHMFP